MNPWKTHLCRISRKPIYESDVAPPDASDFRQSLEPWLSAVFQSEHLSLLVGNGLTRAISSIVEIEAPSMDTIELDKEFADMINEHATNTAKLTGKNQANIEDQIRVAICLLKGFQVLKESSKAETIKNDIDQVLLNMIKQILTTERDLKKKAELDKEEKGVLAKDILCSFLLSFASRTPTRDRLNIFTTNYDRIIEYACDWTALRLIDRFVGTLSPMFRASRMDIDLHYNPPGIRGEPRYLEGVVKFTKLHGSIDWRYENNALRRIPIPFGAGEEHPDIPEKPTDHVIVYPNPAKDLETCEYPYAELFRDFSAALCRPNSSLVTYGYGFGDEHINRILKDMLTLPSTHMVIISWDNAEGRIEKFCKQFAHAAQITLLIGNHFGDISTLVENYLPKPALDQISIRKARLQQNRGDEEKQQKQEQGEPNDV